MLHQLRPTWRLTALEWSLPIATAVVIGMWFVDPLRRSDFLVFLRAAGDVSHGGNPYTPTSDPFLLGGSAYVYPYFTAFLFVPLTLVPVPVADVLWFALSAGALIVGCHMLGLRDPLSVSALLASSTCIRSLQVGALNLVLLLLAATMWRYRNNTKVLALTFMLLAGSKLFLLPVAVWVLLTRGRTAVLAAGAALGAFLGLGLLLQPISTQEFLHVMDLLSAHEGRHSMSVLRWASELLPSSDARLLAVLLGLVVLTAGVIYRLRRPEPGDAVLLGASLVAALIATPIYWSHYTVLLAVVVILGKPSRRTVLLFVAGSWLVSRPQLATPILQLPWPARFVLLYTGMAIALFLVSVPKGASGPFEPSHPDPALVD